MRNSCFDHSSFEIANRMVRRFSYLCLMPGFFEKKWVNVTIILLVFTCTGLTVARLGVLITGALGFERFSWEYWLVWIFGLLPIYQVILLIYAFIFGKFQYFKAKQLKLWRRITGQQKKQSKDSQK